MSLNDIMGGNQKIKKVHVTEIRLNQNNMYNLEGIEELAQSIKEQGQLENGVAYYEEKDDGKFYTLLGGHRRFSAIALLYARHEHDGYMNLLVIEKPKNKAYEEILIIQDNNQRTKSKKERMREIKVAMNYYETLTEEEKKQLGEKLIYRDRIGKLVGISGRQVGKYLKEQEGKENVKKPIYNKDNICKDIKNTMLKLNSTLSKMQETKIDFVYKDKNLAKAIKVEISRLKILEEYIKKAEEIEVESNNEQE